MKLKQEELKKLPYLQINSTDGRLIPLFPFWLDGEFSLPILDSKRGEIAILSRIPVFIEGNYISKELANPQTDYSIPIIELVMQRYSFKQAVTIINTIEADILNLSAILEKYELIFRDWLKQTGGIRGQHFLIETELEFLFYNVRSMYDQLQALIKIVWSDTRLFDVSVKKQELPRSFRDVILHGGDDQIYSEEEITKKWGIPAPFAAFYHAQAEFFKLCRAIRDRMIHTGKPISESPCQFTDVNAPLLFGNDAPLFFGNSAPPFFGNNTHPENK